MSPKVLTPAQRHDDGLGGAVHLGDLDLAVQHHEQLAPGRAFLKNDVIDIKLIDAFLDRHGAPSAFWLACGAMLVGNRPAQTEPSGNAAEQHGHEVKPQPRGCRCAATKPARITS
jgi:hypothetical protein